MITDGKGRKALKACNDAKNLKNTFCVHSLTFIKAILQGCT